MRWTVCNEFAMTLNICHFYIGSWDGKKFIENEYLLVTLTVNLKFQMVALRPLSSTSLSWHNIVKYDGEQVIEACK